MKDSKSKIFELSLILLTGYFSCTYLTSQVGIRRNVTESLSTKYFLSTPFKKVQKNQYVSFRHPLSQLPLAKLVAGLPGDTITHVEDHVFVNDFDCGKTLKKSNSGIELTPLQQGIIPNGYVFVYAPHDESFDSRYQEFGLIPISQLDEALWPIY